MARTETLSIVDDAASGDDAGACEYLFLLCEAHRPGATPVRLALADLDEITVGRGAERAVERRGRSLAVRVVDPWMSTAHARFFRAHGAWLVEDAGSKNGSLVDGEPRTRAELEDGALVELGHTFFLFRSALPRAGTTILEASSLPALPGLRTLSPAYERELSRLPALARAGVPVILEGETGTGKEVLARAVHALSERRGAFVAINCGALPAALVEGQLFGHKKGAFSGATDDRPGLVRAAEGGTLLLDEIGELPAPAQAALLRVLQEREVLPLGAVKPVPVDVRVLAATHRPLAAMVASGAFRRDLHARIAGYHLALPPLRDRREDLGLLIAAHLPEGASLQPRAARALVAHAFPGNVRELEKALTTAVALAGGKPIELAHLPEDLRSPRAAPDEEAQLKDRLAALLRAHQGNVSAVAREMGKARMQVQRWMKRFGLAGEDFR